MVDQGIAGATVERAGGSVTREVLLADAANLPPIAPRRRCRKGRMSIYQCGAALWYREDVQSRVDGVSVPPRRSQIAESRRSYEHA
jgi:hypothetical protein